MSKELRKALQKSFVWEIALRVPKEWTVIERDRRCIKTFKAFRCCGEKVLDEKLKNQEIFRQVN